MHSPLPPHLVGICDDFTDLEQLLLTHGRIAYTLAVFLNFAGRATMPSGTLQHHPRRKLGWQDFDAFFRRDHGFPASYLAAFFVIVGLGLRGTGLATGHSWSESLAIALTIFLAVALFCRLVFLGGMLLRVRYKQTYRFPYDGRDDRLLGDRESPVCREYRVDGGKLVLFERTTHDRHGLVLGPPEGVVAVPTVDLNLDLPLTVFSGDISHGTTSVQVRLHARPHRLLPDSCLRFYSPIYANEWWDKREEKSRVDESADHNQRVYRGLEDKLNKDVMIGLLEIVRKQLTATPDIRLQDLKIRDQLETRLGEHWQIERVDYVRIVVDQQPPPGPEDD